MANTGGKIRLFTSRSRKEKMISMFAVFDHAVS